MKQTLGAVTQFLIRIEQGILLLCTALMLLAMIAAILARPLHIDVPWATPMVLSLMIVSTFAGAALASATRRHIGMDLLTKVLKPRGRALLGTVTALIGVVLTAFLCASGMTWVKTNMEFGEPISLALKIPDWYLQLVVPIGFALCGIHFAINAAIDLRAFITGDTSHLPSDTAAAAHGVNL